MKRKKVSFRSRTKKPLGYTKFRSVWRGGALDSLRRKTNKK